MKHVIVIGVLSLLWRCNTRSHDAVPEKVVARAGDEDLSAETYVGDFVSTGIIDDSIYNSKKSIEKWAEESLFYQEAMGKLNDDELAIEKEVAKYRKTLVNYIYQGKIIEANLDTVISHSEIEDYYNAHRDNFILRENIVKVNYFKVAVHAPGLDKIRKLTGSSRLKDVELLSTLISQNAENYFMNDSTWLYMDDLRKEIPQLNERAELELVPGRVLEFIDAQYFYYLKVRDVKVKNGLSPLNFESVNIRKFIINARKTQLINGYKQLLLEKAKSAKTFEIY